MAPLLLYVPPLFGFAPLPMRVVAGLTIVVQRPGTAKGVTFQTLEDEAGTVDLVLKPPVASQVMSELSIV